MKCESSGDFVTNRAWLKNAVKGRGWILRCGSALEYLDMFVGYLGEDTIEVYSTEIGEFENINYCILKNFNEIEYFEDDGVLCCTLEQAINDMLSNFENADEQALTEALANYYHAHSNTFDGLFIKPENMKNFEYIKSSAVRYFCDG